MATLTSVITGSLKAQGLRAGCPPLSFNLRKEDHSVSFISHPFNASVRGRRALERATGPSVTTSGRRSLIVCREAAYDLCYGTKTSKPLTPNQLMEIYQSRGISKMWLSPTPLSPPNEAVFSILQRIIDDPDLKIKVVLCIDYTELDLLADESKAKQWVDTYITDHASIIGHVCVGDVIGSGDFRTRKFQDAMGHLKKLLPDSVKLSTIFNESILLGVHYTAATRPSTCKVTARSTEILLFLSELLGSPFPLFVRTMPYFMISPDVPIENCILKDEAPIYMHDGDYSYRQAFDSMLDSICCALKKVDGLGKVDIHVVSGWPNAGPTPYASKEYAKGYISNLVEHIGKPTPRANIPADIFIYSLMDEDKLETTEEVFKHLGVKPYVPRA